MAKRQKSAPDESQKKRHPHWDQIVSYAYLRMMGRTQVEGAKGVGRSRRTVQGWEADTELWQAARAEARERWFADVEDASRRAVLNSVNAGNATLGMEILERLDERLAPPKQRHEHTGKEGGPIKVEVYADVDGLPEVGEE